MNPLTLVKRTQKITAKEAELGISDEASWHAKYKNSAYIFVGGIPFDLTEGDLLAVFAQYGEVVDVNLVRDKDNLNGAKVLGRTIRVDHVADYKKEKRMKRKSRRRGKNVVSAVHTKEVIALVELHANLLMMSKDVQTQDGALERVNQGGVMTNMMGHQAVVVVILPVQRVI